MTPETTFLRFGDPPASGRSRNWRDGFDEPGVSVLCSARPAASTPGAWDLDGADDTAKFILGACDRRIARIVLLAGPLAPAHIVTGDVVGRGTEGEPCLASVRIVATLPRLLRVVWADGAACWRLVPVREA